MTPTLLTSGSSAKFLKEIRLIATDMDGTLTKSGKFTPALLNAFVELRKANIAIAIVTGRSAGWVQAIVNYLPIDGAIAENGGLYFPNADRAPEPLVSLTVDHRDRLAQVFRELQIEFPQLQPAIDNAFRLTDWTFDVQGLSLADLERLSDRAHHLGWGFTYSNVQCHIKLPEQDKAAGLQQVIDRHFPHLSAAQVATVGDSPNDESLFDPQRFPHSIGVANLRHYADRMQHQPAHLTAKAEVDGFCELAQLLISASKD
ncbi:HAD family phosphatase [Microcoleus sp. FACHB-1515]|uniref:HAD family hydrolase n=1 Tax=Cyanophyceae TaxID=3028117 RepID=UPI0016890883|nr:HAD family hydrolase [Microcoleus sp. FACHB-1515]MBD2089695.1 HAD family phosphatase [Microcoleus sp. FACHB-1515]